MQYCFSAAFFFFIIYIFLLKWAFHQSRGLIWFTTSGSNGNYWKESVLKNFITKVRKYAPKFSFYMPRIHIFNYQSILSHKKGGQLSRSKNVVILMLGYIVWKEMLWIFSSKFNVFNSSSNFFLTTTASKIIQVFFCIAARAVDISFNRLDNSATFL